MSKRTQRNSTGETAIQVIQRTLEFFDRHHIMSKPYDKAIHIAVSIKDAGFTIVKARQQKEGQ